MSRPRKPTEKHILDGTFRKDRHGPPADVLGDDVAAKPPERPAGLAPTAAVFWDRIIGLLEGVVRERDGPQLHQLCFWWSQWETAELSLQDYEIGTIAHTRIFNAASTASQNFDRIARRFGMTPVDRAAMRAEATARTKPKVATKPKTALDKKGAPKGKKR